MNDLHLDLLVEIYALVVFILFRPIQIESYLEIIKVLSLKVHKINCPRMIYLDKDLAECFIFLIASPVLRLWSLFKAEQPLKGQS